MGPHLPPLQTNHLLEWLILHVYRLLVSVKRIQPKNNQMREMHKARYWASMSSLGLPAPEMVTSPGALGISLFKSFYGAQSPSPSPPWKWGWSWEFPLADHLGLLVTRPILRLSRDPTLSHRIHRNSGVTKRGWLWITKVTLITWEISGISGALLQEGPHTHFTVPQILYAGTGMSGATSLSLNNFSFAC